MAIAAGWAAFVGFLKDNPVARFLVWLALALIGWNLLKSHLKEAGRDAERKAIAIKQAQVKADRVEYSSQTVAQERTHADQAVQARDSSPLYPDFDSLPDAQKRILLGSRGSAEGS